MTTKDNMLTDVSAELEKEFGKHMELRNVQSSMMRLMLFIPVKYYCKPEKKQRLLNLNLLRELVLPSHIYHV